MYFSFVSFSLDLQFIWSFCRYFQSKASTNLFRWTLRLAISFIWFLVRRNYQLKKWKKQCCVHWIVRRSIGTAIEVNWLRIIILMVALMGRECVRKQNGKWEKNASRDFSCGMQREHMASDDLITLYISTSAERAKCVNMKSNDSKARACVTPWGK